MILGKKYLFKKLPTAGLEPTTFWSILLASLGVTDTKNRDCIFSHVRPFYEQAVSNLDRSLHRSLLVLVAHSLFIEGAHTTKSTAYVHVCSAWPCCQESESSIFKSVSNKERLKKDVCSSPFLFLKFNIF